MVFFHVAVEGFEVEVKLAEVLRFEFLGFQFHDNQTLEPPMKEEQVCLEIAVAYLNPVFFPHEQKIPAQLQDEFFHLGDQGFLQIGFIVIGG
jgi:hypothetical protein